jgi:hypothetical protein
MHKRHGGAIGLTGVRLAAAVWSERATASGDSEAAVALPPQLGFRRGKEECTQTNGRGSFPRS